MKTEMEYRRLGKSGLKVSVFSFGSWVTFSNQLKEKDATEISDGNVFFFQAEDGIRDSVASRGLGDV